MLERPFASAIAAALLMATAVSATQPRPAGDGTAFDSRLDGVWVGSMQAKSATGSYDYTLLLNLDAGATTATGVVLLADDLFGNPTSFAFFPLTAQVKGSRLFAEVALGVTAPGDLPDADPLRLDLRLRRGRLTGKVRGAGLEPGKVDLELVDAATPLQQTWLEQQPTARSAGPLALTLLQLGESVTGIGLSGAEFGSVVAAVLDGDRLEATLQLPSGDLLLSLTLGDGALRGTVTSSTGVESVSLFAGGVPKPPAVATVFPDTIPAGRETAITLRGKDLAPGFLLHLDTDGVTATPPVVGSAKDATVLVTVDAAVAAGTDLGLFIVGTDGVVRDLDAALRTDPAAPVSFSGDLLPIFTSRCATSGCHVTPSPDPEYGTTSPPGDLILEANAAYGNLVNRRSSERPDLNRVTPGDPDASYLILKLRGDPSIVGNRMPFGGPYLSDATIAMFVQWVRDGAPRN